MATPNVENVRPPHPFDAIAVDIEDKYEGIVNVARERKRTLLTRLSEFREEYDSLIYYRDKTERELTSMKEDIEKFKENALKTMQQEFLAKIEDKMVDLRVSTANYSIKFECESEELESKLSQLGELVKVDYKLPNYSEIESPVVAVGKKGNENDQFHGPRGVAFDERTKMIYVCDLWNSRVKMLSIEGGFIGDFGRNDLDAPCGILLSEDSIYVTDTKQRDIVRFSIKTNRIIKRVGKWGSFNTPTSLARSPEGDLHVTEDFNNRISVLDLDLSLKRIVEHDLILSPVDVRFTNNEMLILSSTSPARVHLLTLEGAYLKPIIIILHSPPTFFFCLDRANNILVSVGNLNLVQVYNEEGEFRHSVGKGHLGFPFGLTTTKSGKLIVVSDHEDHGLQIF